MEICYRSFRNESEDSGGIHSCTCQVAKGDPPGNHGPEERLESRRWLAVIPALPLRCRFHTLLGGWTSLGQGAFGEGREPDYLKRKSVAVLGCGLLAHAYAACRSSAPLTRVLFQRPLFASRLRQGFRLRQASADGSPGNSAVKPFPASGPTCNSLRYRLDKRVSSGTMSSDVVIRLP